MHSTHAHRLPLGTSNNLDFGSYKLSLDFSLCFCMPPTRGGCDQYHQNVINTPKPFKNLVKMEDFAWFLEVPDHATAE